MPTSSSGSASLAAYTNRYRTEDTLAYITDVYGKGTTMLTTDQQVIDVTVLDDHPVNAPEVGRHAHHAALILRPTAAARRWGTAIASNAISQEQFLDLVVDGIAEIASPDEGLELRDLIQDLHAIRSTEVKSVIRTGGEGAIQLSENVKLHAGPGDAVQFPEQMTIVLAPFAGIGESITPSDRPDQAARLGRPRRVLALLPRARRRDRQSDVVDRWPPHRNHRPHPALGAVSPWPGGCGVIVRCGPATTNSRSLTAPGRRSPCSCRSRSRSSGHRRWSRCSPRRSLRTTVTSSILATRRPRVPSTDWRALGWDRQADHDELLDDVRRIATTHSAPVRRWVTAERERLGIPAAPPFTVDQLDALDSLVRRAPVVVAQDQAAEQPQEHAS